MSIYDVENSLAETEEYKKASYTQKIKCLIKQLKNG